MKYFNANLELLSTRYPLLYLHALTNQNYKKEKLFFAKNESDLDLDKFDTLVIYKCFFDATYQKIRNWIKKKDSKLHIIEDNLDDLIAFFHTKEANYLLKNIKVNFHLLENVKKTSEEIASATRTKKINVLTFLSNNKKFANLKNEIIQNNLITFFANFDSLNSDKIFKNFISNCDKLDNSFLVNSLKNKMKDIPVIVVGAGPSLKYSFDKIKALQNKALIIAGGSAITCLTQAGILPHLGVIIDPNVEEYRRIKDSLAFQLPIIYSTRVNKGVFHLINGDLGYIKAASCGFFEIFLDQKLNIKEEYPFLKFEEKAMSVTTVCVKIAKMLGCNPIILDGVDLAYSEDKLYALDIIENNKTIKEDAIVKQEIIKTKDKRDNFVNTNLNWQIEKTWFNLFAKTFKKKSFINATKLGLKIEGFKDLSLDEIEKKYLLKEYDFIGHLHLLIEQNKMQGLKDKIVDLKNDIEKSFKKCVLLLNDLIKNNAEYVKILAKEELEQEIAYQFFLLNLDHALNKFYDDKSIYKKLKKSASFFLKQMKN